VDHQDTDRRRLSDFRHDSLSVWLDYGTADLIVQAYHCIRVSAMSRSPGRRARSSLRAKAARGGSPATLQRERRRHDPHGACGVAGIGKVQLGSCVDSA
jgi:hypothetical protein